MIEKAKVIAKDVAFNGGRALIVGGFVRDMMLGKPSKDVDIEVYGLDHQSLLDVLAPHGKTETVGASFGVVKLFTEEGDFDFSLPRRESKTGKGHKGFIATPDPTMTPMEASARRDVTFNALAYDPLTGEILDFHNGIEDLKAGILRATSSAFAEDPLRVLRCMQFCGRFDLSAEPMTVKMCEDLLVEAPELPKERIWEEFRKLILKSEKPSLGIRFLEQCGWIRFFPELRTLRCIEQEPEWHPEGDVFEHTIETIDAAARIATRENLSDEERLVLILSALCHDLGKIFTTVEEEGRIRSRGHEDLSGPLAESLLNRIGAPAEVREHVSRLVVRHMSHLTCQTPSSVRRLSLAVAPSNIRMLSLLIESDHSGRPPLPAVMPYEAIRLVTLAEAERIASEAPKPVIKQASVGSLGYRNEYWSIVHQYAFEAQIEGHIVDEHSAFAWIRENVPTQREIDEANASVPVTSLIEGKVTEITPYKPTVHKGNMLRGACHLHADPLRSFRVKIKENRVRCLKCSTSGGPVEFFMATDGISMREAVDMLLKKK